jgi:hypothetical protein
MQAQVKIAVIVDSGSTRSWVYRLTALLQEYGHVQVIHLNHEPTQADSTTIAAEKLEQSLFWRRSPVLAQRCREFPEAKSISQDELLANLSVDLILNLSQEELPLPNYNLPCPILHPIYHSSLKERGLIQAILSQTEVPFLAIARQDGTILTSSLVAIPERTLLLPSLETCFGRLISLFLRAVEHVLYQRRLSEPLSPPPTTINPAQPLYPGLFRLYRNRLFNMIRYRIIRDNHWFVAFRQVPPQAIADKRAVVEPTYEIVSTSSDRFYADPFLVEYGGQIFLFVEEYSYRDPRKKGIISCLQLDGNSFSSPRVVLDRPYHLSYPFVFVADGEIYMIPETSQNRTVELYRATQFPDQWELDTVLLDNLCAVDATLHFHDHRWWMFVNIAEHGASSWDELSIFYADSFKGKWLPHPMNPVKSDARSARPAGKLFYHQGRLLRPAQDCSKGYGGSLVLCEVTTLTPDQYAEEVIHTLAPGSLSAQSKGLHTLNHITDMIVVDGKTTVSKWPFSKKEVASIGG